MATWVLGDIHGCAAELEALLEQLALAAGDRLVACGDLFHRGPDPLGVLELLQRARADFVLGNHERVPLACWRLAPSSAHKSDRPALRERFPDLEEHDLAGDGGEPCSVPAERRADVLRFLQGHSGFYLQHDEIEGAGPTSDGRPWCVIHAGLQPGLSPVQNSVRDLIGLKRLSLPGRPWWYELHEGPQLVLFGHTPSPLPRMQRAGERLLALGLDTGCVYGGRLTAYSPEQDEFRSVRARRAYAVAGHAALPLR